MGRAWLSNNRLRALHQQRNRQLRQMLIAHAEAANGMETVKKFAVVVGK